MHTKNTTLSSVLSLLNWVFCVLFFIMGVLNILLVHAVPGLFYLVLSLLFLPQTNALLKRKLGFAMPLILKIVVGFVVLWGTLAVGDLAEILGL